jgi:hypothetical protein
MREHIAAQIGDDPLAQRHHKVIANARSERENADHGHHGPEIQVDHACAFG